MKKIEEIYQNLNLIRMSIVTIRRQINDQLDGMDMEIARLIPEEEGRGRHITSLKEARARIKAACTRQHGKRIPSGPEEKGQPKERGFRLTIINHNQLNPRYQQINGAHKWLMIDLNHILNTIVREGARKSITV